MSDFAKYLASFSNNELFASNNDPITTDSRLPEGGRVIDADTLQTSGGTRVRLSGVNAAEVDSFDPRTGLFKTGELGGNLQKNLVTDIIKSKGFSEPVLTNKKDPYGRSLGDLKDPLEGNRLTDYLIKNNVVDLRADASPQQVQLKAFGELERKLRERNEPADRFQQATEGKYTYPNEGDLVNDILRANEANYPIIPKGIAPNAKMFGAYPDYFSGPAYVNPNETDTGYAKGLWGKLKTGLVLGYENTAKDLYGAAEMRYTGASNKDQAKWAAMQIDRLSADIDSLPLMKDTEAFNARSGEWQLDSASKVFNHALSVLSSSAVPMGVTIGANILSKLAVTNPITAAGAPAIMSIPVAMNAGRVWNNQPKDQKDETRAWTAGLGITALDSLGLKFIAPSAVVGSFGKKQFDDYALAELIKKGATKQEAINKLKDVYGSVTKQLGTVLKGVSIGVAGEGITEPTQELVEHWGSNPQGMGDSELLKNKLKNSAFSGALVGGILAVPGSVMENRAFKNYLAGEIGEEMSSRTRKSSAVEAFQNKNGVLSDLDLALQVKMDRLNNPVGSVPLDQMFSEQDKATLGQQFLNVATEPRKLVEAARNFVRPYMQFDWAQKIGAMIDSPLARGFTTGLNASKRGRQLATSTEFEFNNAFEGISDIKQAYTLLQQAISTGNVTGLPQNIIDLAVKLDNVAQNFASQINKLDGDNASIINLIAKTDDFFIKNKLPMADRVKKDAALFQSLLEKFGTTQGPTGILSPMTQTEAAELTQQLMQEITPYTLEKLLESGITTNPNFDTFMDNNIKSNASRIIDRLSTKAVRNTVFGRNGENVAHLIQQGINNKNITVDQGRALAAKVSNYLDAFDGKLNTIKNPLVKGAQENVNFLSTLIYMDTAMFANLAEIAYGSIGLNNSNIPKYWGRYATGVAKNIIELLTSVGNRASRGVLPKVDFKSNVPLNQLGYLSQGSDEILLQEGVSLNSRVRRSITRLMFKLNLIEGATNLARTVRNSFADDEMGSLFGILSDSPNKDAARWARDRLEYYRVNVDELLRIYKQTGFDESTMSTQDLEIFGNQKMNFSINFIDEFIARPEPGSTPIIFDDHRFVLFTQFKRFSAHITANVIPQLWETYIKRGNPQYNYGAFSGIVMAVALAYLGLTLKNMLRGEDDDEKKKIGLGKAIEYSWLGTYGDFYDMGESAYKVATGKQSASTAMLQQMPGVNTVYDIGKDTVGALSDDNATSEKSKGKLLKKIPFLGETTSLRDFYKKD